MDASTNPTPDPFLFIKRWPWEKILIWALFLGLLWLLRGFFTIIFVTFVVTYVLRNVVNWLCRRCGRPVDTGRFYKAMVLVVFSALVTAIVLLGAAVGPLVGDQANSLLQKLATLSVEDHLEGTLQHSLGGERFAALVQDPDYQGLRARIQDGSLREGEAPSTGPSAPDARPASTDAVLEVLGAKLDPEEYDKLVHGQDFQNAMDRIARDPGAPSFQEQYESALRRVVGDDQYATLASNRAYQEVVSNVKTTLLAQVPKLLSSLTGLLNDALIFALHFFISLVFSLIILLDIPRLRARVQTLDEGRLSKAYREIAPSLAAFGSVLGRAFQAQLLIAVNNTVITFIGMWILGIESRALLAIIVFVCSFVPVVGAMVSTVPIGLIALQQDGGGPGLLLQVIAMVLVVHAVEAYILNPYITGDLLRIHPLIVLVLLLVSESLFHVWGLLLGVPLASYVFSRFIQYHRGESPGRAG